MSYGAHPIVRIGQHVRLQTWAITLFHDVSPPFLCWNMPLQESLPGLPRSLHRVSSSHLRCPCFANCGTINARALLRLHLPLPGRNLGGGNTHRMFDAHASMHSLDVDTSGWT